MVFQTQLKRPADAVCCGAVLKEAVRLLGQTCLICYNCLKVAIGAKSMVFIKTGRSVALALVLMAMALLTWAKPPHSAFFLHNGDTVVFYGDSITDQQGYTQDIENYVITRFSNIRVKFINSGWGGDTVQGGGGGSIDVRLKRDVIPYKPNVVTIMLGMNDGGYTSFDQAHYDVYTKGLTHIVDLVKRDVPGVRITLLTPSYFDYHAMKRLPLPANQSYNWNYPAPDYNQTLLRYGAFVKLLGALYHLTVVDENLPLKEATEVGRKSNPAFALSPEGVHPFPDGHLIMAAAVLKAWHAPSTVAKITLRPNHPESVTSPLPWPIPADAMEAFQISPLPGSLDLYTLSGKNLSKDPASHYQLEVNGAVITTVTAAQLKQGINLNDYPNLPQNQQARQVAAITAQMIAQWHHFFKGDTGFSGSTTGLAKPGDVPAQAEINAFLTEDESLNGLRAQAYEAAQPKPYTFELVPVH
jgi:lysophospholipase L1-like esterase